MLHPSHPARPAGTPDLFDQHIDDWKRNPRLAFDAWLAQQSFRRSSAEVYSAQWGHFLDWLALRRVALLSVSDDTVAQFLTELDARKPQRARYLRLIERVFDHLHRTAAASNPARRTALQTADANWPIAADNEPTGFLTRAERDALAAHVHAPLPALTMGAYWREARDRALAAVFLGAGLKMAEAQALHLHGVLDGTHLLVEADDPRFSRRVRIARFTEASLETWLALRARAGIRGTLVFPAAPSGRPMHKATVLRAIDEQVAAAGIAATREARASPQTLRNSFAATLLEDGEAPERLAQWLGFSQPLSAQRLHAAWQAWDEARQRDTSEAVQRAMAAPPD